MSPEESREPLDVIAKTAEAPPGNLQEASPPDGPPAQPPMETANYPTAIPPLPPPGFLSALGWCMLFLLVLIVMSQVGGVVGTVIVLVGSPDGAATIKSISEEDYAKLMRTPAPPRDVNDEQIKAGKSIIYACSMAVGELSAFLFVWLLLRFRIGRSWSRIVALRIPNPVHLGLALLSFPGFVVLPTFVYFIFRQSFPGFTFDHQAHVEELVRYWPIWFGILAVGVGPGLSEEFFCRAFLGRGLVARYGVLFGMVLTSFFFGFLHMDPPHVIATLLMGLALHYVYYMSRSLWLPVLLHLLNNSMSVLGAHKELGFLSGSGQEEAPPVLVFGSAALWVAVGWALYESRSRLGPKLGAEGPHWQPPYPSVAYPPEGSGMVVIRDWPSVYSLAASFTVFAGVMYLLIVTG